MAQPGLLGNSESPRPSPLQVEIRSAGQTCRTHSTVPRSTCNDASTTNSTRSRQRANDGDGEQAPSRKRASPHSAGPTVRVGSRGKKWRLSQNGPHLAPIPMTILAVGRRSGFNQAQFRLCDSATPDQLVCIYNSWTTSKNRRGTAQNGQTVEAHRRTHGQRSVASGSGGRRRTTWITPYHNTDHSRLARSGQACVSDSGDARARLANDCGKWTTCGERSGSGRSRNVLPESSFVDSSAFHALARSRT